MTAQQLATFQVAGCSSNGPECAATSAHPSQCLRLLPSRRRPFREIHVEAQPGDVMAGAGGAAWPAPDVCDQPPGTPLDKYHNYGQQDIEAASTVVRAAWRSAQSREFESKPQQLYF